MLRIKTLNCLDGPVMRFLVRTSLLALFLTYAANWWFFSSKNGSNREVRVDCSLYSAGQGLGPDGKPFQVTFPISSHRTIWAISNNWLKMFRRVSRISIPTTCVNTPSPPPSWSTWWPPSMPSACWASLPLGPGDGLCWVSVSFRWDQSILKLISLF